MGRHDPSRAPNLVVSGTSHVAWMKFANYIDVALRVVPVADGSLTMDAKDEKVRASLVRLRLFSRRLEPPPP